MLTIYATYTIISQQFPLGEIDDSGKIENKNGEYENKNGEFSNEISINMNDVCQYLHKNSVEFQNDIKSKIGNQAAKDNINAILRDSEEYENIWPVFRWGCEVETKDDAKIVIGIALNKYCENIKLGYKIEAYFKNYQDPDSWFCIRVPGDYLDQNKPLPKK